MKILKSNQLPRQLKATISFVLASSITQGLNLLVTPIFVRVMSTDEIGVVTNFNSWATLIGIVVNMMLYANSYMIAMNEFASNRNEYTSFSLCVSMTISMCFFGVYFINPLFFQKILGMNSRLILLMLVGFFFLPATNFWMARQRYEYKYISVLFVSIGSAICSTVASLIAVCVASNNGYSTAENRLFATYFVNIIVAIIISISIYTKSRPKWNAAYAKFILIVNSPMIIHSLAKNVLDVSDRIMISSMVGNSQAGIYGTLYSLSSLIMIFWNAINLAITPYMFSKMNNIEKNRDDLRMFLNMLLLGFLFLSAFFSLLAPEIIGVFTTDIYLKEISVVPPIISGCFITSVYSLIGNILLYNKKTVSIMLGTLSAGVINVLLNFLCIPFWGFHAAAYTTFIGYVVLTLVLYIFMKKIRNLTANFFDMRFSVIICVVAFIINMVISFLYPYRVIRLIIAMVVILIAYFQRKKIIKKIKEIKEERE